MCCAVTKSSSIRRGSGVRKARRVVRSRVTPITHGTNPVHSIAKLSCSTLKRGGLLRVVAIRSQ